MNIVVLKPPVLGNKAMLHIGEMMLVMYRRYAELDPVIVDPGWYITYNAKYLLILLIYC